MEERSRLSANRNCPDEQNRRRKMVMRMDLGVLVQVLSLLFSFFSGGVMVAAERWDGIIISQDNYDGLQAFKKSLVDPYGYLKSWNGTGIGACSGEWVGIKCVKGQVIAIQLPWKGLAGKISGKIGQLTALRKISLHDNLIDRSFGKCFVLQTLDLSQNFLSVNNNDLSGEIPDTWGRGGTGVDGDNKISSVSGNQEQLKVLNLDNNSFSGSLPNSITKLRMLKVFSAAGNRINGSIVDVEFGKLVDLQLLDLSGSQISASPV